VKILQLVSSRGWSSDAYWAVRVSRELERRGHEVTLGCRAGTDERVIAPALHLGVRRIETFAFASGLAPLTDPADVRRLAAKLAETDIVHVHRGKEHWLAAAANRLSRTPRPLVRTRHIAHAVRPHAANRWLYRRATAWVVTVTDAIRRQYIASGLLGPERVTALPGGADTEAYRPRPADSVVRRRLGGEPDRPLVGMVAGLRVMKGHGIVVEAAGCLAARGLRPRFAFIGRGATEPSIRAAIRAAGLDAQITVSGFADDLPQVLAALDLVLYVPLESDGMSRVVFECLAAGRPLIASRVGVVPEVLTDGEHAVLVPAGDAAALADAIARLLGDARVGERLGHAGRRLVEGRYSGAQLAAALEARYARLVTAPAA
jgi:glycosyltransferase involved in cell wall biosynthesis